MNDEIIKEALSYALSKDIHEAWRETRKKKDGTYTPKMKMSKDDRWNNIHGTNMVDIANTPFDELPSNWQIENLEASKVVINLVFDKVINELPITSEELDEMGSIIHNEWLKRNRWVFDTEFGNPKLAVSYDKLPKIEQDKNKEQIKPAIIIVNKYANGMINIEDLCKQYGIENKSKIMVKR